MKRTLILAIVAVLVFGIVIGSGVYAEMFVYPAKGQSKDQQDRDEYECYKWAVQQSGVDPMKMAEQQASAQTQTTQRGGAVRGAARGAALGAVGGAIAGDAGKGAAVGAGVGAAGGAMSRRSSQRQQQQAQQQAKQQQQAQLDKYNRAYGACLEGRGYTVSQ
ncbi:MAG: hypothetical protein JSU72_05880 [Deltaproteobacteria bacterium]|nr:MAG: hypothetical protein JSU72_05880 [Deltaproteobacteria bacterium]